MHLERDLYENTQKRARNILEQKTFVASFCGRRIKGILVNTSGVKKKVGSKVSQPIKFLFFWRKDKKETSRFQEH